jgi:hypothetical protein
VAKILSEEDYFKLCFDDLINTDEDEFYHNEYKSENNIRILNETIDYFIKIEDYEKCSILQNIKFNLNIRK